MPIADSQQRDALDFTIWKSRNTTIASMVCDQILRVTADATIEADAAPDLYAVDSTTATVTLTLPPLADVPTGRKLAFYKLVAANSMVIDGSGAETIEGAANQTRSAQYAVVVVEKVETAAGTFAWMLHKADVADGEVGTDQLADLSVTTAKLADLAVTTAKLGADAVDGTKIGDDTIDSEHYVAGSIDNEHLAADSVDSDQYVDGSVDPIHLAAASVAPAADAPAAILDTTTEMLVQSSDNSTVVISTSSSAPGQTLMIRMDTYAGTGQYTLGVSGGTLTLNSVGETALVKRNVANTEWHVVALTAGDAGGSPATVV